MVEEGSMAMAMAQQIRGESGSGSHHLRVAAEVVVVLLPVRSAFLLVLELESSFAC